MVENLTHKALITQFEAEAVSRIAAVPEYETVEATIQRKDGKGKLILDADGVPELLVKRVLKRSIVEAKENDRLAKLREQYPIMVEAPVPAYMPRATIRERIEA